MTAQRHIDRCFRPAGQYYDLQSLFLRTTQELRPSGSVRWSGTLDFPPNRTRLRPSRRERSVRPLPLWAVGLTHTFNIAGAVVYVLHFPERWWPGKFDIFGASHQLMHTAIVGAAITLLAGSIVAFDHAHNKQSKGFWIWS